MTCSCTDTVLFAYTVRENGDQTNYLVYDSGGATTACGGTLTMKVRATESCDCVRLRFTWDETGKVLPPPFRMVAGAICPCEVSYAKQGVVHTYDGKFQVPPYAGASCSYDWVLGRGAPACTITITIIRQ